MASDIDSTESRSINANDVDRRWLLRTSRALRRQSASKAMRLGTAYLDVDFAIPPRVNMKFVGAKVAERDEVIRDSDELEIACK
jgi:hypothetical protein